MRHRLLIPLILTLAACSSDQSMMVDPGSIPPLTGQERALLISADASAIAGDYDAAERNYLTAVSQSKGQVIAHLSLARLYASQNKPGKAEDILNKAAEIQPYNAEVNRMRGKIALQDGRPGEALRYFDEGLKYESANLDLLTGAGIANDLKHQHDAAQVIYLRALSLHPKQDLTPVKTNLAMSYILGNKAQKAVDLLKNEVKQPNAPAVMRHNLAIAYGILGRHAEARALVKGELTEEEREQTLKRLKEHIAADVAKQHPADKDTRKKPDKKAPAAVSRPDLQPNITETGDE